MQRNLLKKIVIDGDLKATGFNIATAWFVGNVANIISNAFFRFNLNQYNSVNHLVAGVGIGTFTYRKAGGGTKGVLAGLTAATIVNIGWEAFENGYVFNRNIFNDKESLIDTISDIAVVYAGTTLSFIGEKFKNYITRERVNKRKKMDIEYLIESDKEKQEDRFNSFYEVYCKR